MSKSINHNLVPYLWILVISLFIIAWGLVDNDYYNQLKNEEQYYKECVLPTHICDDSTHITCDGNCECDGMGCN